MTLLEHLKGIFGLSFGFWLIFGLYSILRVQAFIVKRYEQETSLLDTIYFKEHATFTRYLANFHSSALYSGHLMMCLWGWRLFGKKKIFRDIEDPTFVTQHFSKKEIRKIKNYFLSGIIITIHGIAYFFFKFICPMTFGQG